MIDNRMYEATPCCGLNPEMWGKAIVCGCGKTVPEKPKTVPITCGWCGNRFDWELNNSCFWECPQCGGS